MSTRPRIEHIQFQWKLNVLQLLAFVAFSDGKPVSTFPENALARQGCLAARDESLQHYGRTALFGHRIRVPNVVGNELALGIVIGEAPKVGRVDPIGPT